MLQILLSLRSLILSCLYALHELSVLIVDHVGIQKVILGQIILVQLFSKLVATFVMGDFSF